MIVAVSATGPDLDAEVCPRFRDCPYFLIVDSETMKLESINNNSGMSGGQLKLGIARLAANRNAEAMITGNCDRNAIQSLSSAGLRVIEGMTGKAKDAVKMYNTWCVPPIM